MTTPHEAHQALVDQADRLAREHRTPTARCTCCRRTLPRIDLGPSRVCHTCLARCTWGSCAVRAALGLAPRRGRI
jgi:hypothetical protein